MPDENGNWSEEEIQAKKDADEKAAADLAIQEAAVNEAKAEADCKDQAHANAPTVDVHEGDLHEGIAQLDMAHKTLGGHSASDVGGSTTNIAMKYIEGAMVKLKGLLVKKEEPVVAE